MTVTYIFRSAGTGHSIEILFGAVRRALSPYPDLEVRKIYLPHVSRTIWRVWQNLRFVARQQSGLFHVTGDVHYAVLALPPDRTILTIHDCVTLEQNRNRPLRYALFWLLWFYWPIRRAGTVTTVSDKTRQDLLRYVGRIAEKVVVIPNGYDPLYGESSKVFDAHWPVLLQVGTAPHKNLHRLIEAIAGVDCRLLIVGALPLATRIELARRRIAYEHYVNLSRAAVHRLYLTCDIVTFVSTYEGFGMPILEANAIGRAVITSAVEPMRSVAGAAAHRVDPTDVTAIRQGILRLIHNADYRQELIEAGFRNARQYHIETVAARYWALYHACLAVSPEMTSAL